MPKCSATTVLPSPQAFVILRVAQQGRAEAHLHNAMLMLQTHVANTTQCSCCIHNAMLMLQTKHRVPIHFACNAHVARRSPYANLLCSQHATHATLLCSLAILRVVQQGRAETHLQIHNAMLMLQTKHRAPIRFAHNTQPIHLEYAFSPTLHTLQLGHLARGTAWGG